MLLSEEPRISQRLYLTAGTYRGSCLGNLHEADTELGGTDDVLEFLGTEIEGRTTLEFVIPLVSGDALDRPLVPGNQHIILVAFQEHAR